jgi:hypothetical protein
LQGVGPNLKWINEVQFEIIAQINVQSGGGDDIRRKTPIFPTMFFNLGSTIIIIENGPSHYELIFSIVFQLLTIRVDKYKLKMTLFFNY